MIDPVFKMDFRLNHCMAGMAWVLSVSRHIDRTIILYFRDLWRGVNPGCEIYRDG